MSNDTRADEVRTTRKAQGLTQEQLAEKAGLTVRTIRNIEAGRDVSPSSVSATYHALGMPGVRPTWPPHVQHVCDMVGYRLTSEQDPAEVDRLIFDITKVIVGR